MERGLANGNERLGFAPALTRQERWVRLLYSDALNLMLQLITEQMWRKDGGSVSSEEDKGIDLVSEVLREHRKLLLELYEFAYANRMDTRPSSLNRE